MTADVESGYGNSAKDAERTALAVIDAGAVGMNLEDAPGDAGNPLVELSAQIEKIRAVREAAASRGIPLVLNARTDVYLLQVGEPAGRYDETVRRLSAYRDAGADCVFAPGLRDASTISRLVADLRCPLNILAGPGSPSCARTASARSGASQPGLRTDARHAGVLRRVAEELKTSGTYESLAEAPSHAEINKLLGSRN